MEIALEPARPEDLGALSALCLRSKAHWGYDPAFIERCREELTLSPEELATTTIALARGAEGPVALAQLGARFAPDEAELLKLFVEPERIGEGFGRRLILWAREAAAAAGAEAIRIEADPCAAAFYEAIGARQVGEAPSGSIPGRRLPLYLLAL